MKEEYETIDLLEILRLLKKNLLAILAVTILLAVAGYLVSTFAMTPQYEASATSVSYTHLKAEEKICIERYRKRPKFTRCESGT